MFKNPVLKYIESIINKMIKADFPGMAAEMAFMFILGFFPFVLFIMYCFAWIGQKAVGQHILYVLTHIAPSDVSRLLMNTISQVVVFKQGGLMAIICFIVTIALSSNAIAAIMKGLNRAFETEETRPFVYTRILSVVMVFFSMVVLLITVNLIIFGKIILTILHNYSIIPDILYSWIMFLRWPASFIILFSMTYFCYLILPDIKGSIKIKHKAAFVGTLFFSVFWLLGSWTFSLYLDNLNTYNRVFGTIGAFIIMMVWLYYTSMIILLGGEFNYRVFKRLIEKHNSNNAGES